MSHSYMQFKIADHTLTWNESESRLEFVSNHDGHLMGFVERADAGDFILTWHDAIHHFENKGEQ